MKYLPERESRTEVVTAGEEEKSYCVVCWWLSACPVHGRWWAEPHDCPPNLKHTPSIKEQKDTAAHLLQGSWVNAQS